MRLIDADVLRKLPILNGKYDEKNANLHFICGIRFTLDCVDQMPTILPTSANWISVKDKLPKSMINKVLVWLEHEDLNGYIGFGHYEKFMGEEMWYDLENNEQFAKRGYTVTHWMTLPEPPKGVKFE